MEFFVMEVDFVTIREAGRWVTDSSLRDCLDHVAAVHMAKQASVQHLMDQSRFIRENFVAVVEKQRQRISNDYTKVTVL